MLGFAASGSLRLHRFCSSRSEASHRSCDVFEFQNPWSRPQFLSLASLFFGPSLPAALPAFFATTASAVFSPALAAEISLGKVQNLFPRAARLYLARPLMTLWVRCSQPACRPRPASLPFRVPTVESLLSASFSFTSRLRLAVLLRLPPSAPIGSFIQLDSAHAGHTGPGAFACPAGFIPHSQLLRRTPD